LIVRAEPVIGYMHRGAEKLSEYRDPRQVLVLMNRHDWLSAFNNELGWINAVEKLAGVEVPERAQWIRTMMAEWNRILNHLMFMGSYPLELGAMSPMFYAFREREMIQDMMESCTGARMHHSYVRVGGLKDDLPRGFLSRAREVLGVLRAVPHAFVHRVGHIHKLELGDAGLVAVIGRGMQVRLGSSADIDLKLRVAVRVLRSMQSATRAALGYVDVSVPGRPALGYKHSTST
jgi:NADH-quinone oxidoreductase subunit D